MNFLFIQIILAKVSMFFSLFLNNSIKKNFIIWVKHIISFTIFDAESKSSRKIALARQDFDTILKQFCEIIRKC